MGVFNDVVLTWDGEDYVVPDYKVMGLAKVVQSRISFEQLAKGRELALIAEAFSAALRYAGVKSKFTYTDEDGLDHYVLDQEVYDLLFDGDHKHGIQAKMHAIFAMTVPPERLQAMMSTPEKPQATRKTKRRTASSRKRTS